MPPKEQPRTDPVSPGTTTRSAAAALALANAEIDALREQLAAAAIPREMPPPRAGDYNDPRNQYALAATAASFKLPPFYEDDPSMWFGQCESVFRRRLCRDPVQRFDAIVEALPPHIAAAAREIILEINPEEDDTAYDQLRDHLTGTFGKTKWQLAAALLDAPMLGDRKPTAMLTTMRTLKPPGCQEDTLFQMIFIRCLPQPVGAQIMAADLNTVDAMAKMADRIVALPRQAPTAASIEDPGLVAAIPSRGRSPTRPAARGGRGGGGKGGKGRGKGGKGGRAQTPGGDKRGWCRNHLVWGEKAFKCIPPCTWFPEEN
jgi:hypothetical protein